VGGLSHGIRRKIAAAGVSAVMAGGLLFGISSTAEATPAAEAAPATVSAPVVLTAATTDLATVAPGAAIVKANWDNDWNWKHKKRCKRGWHKDSWFWWHHHRSYKRGWSSCRWW
jgi:hypothetical protein